MTEDHYKRLTAMLLDTIGAQQAELDRLRAQLAALAEAADGQAT